MADNIKKNNYTILNGNHLKILACLFMLVDHVGLIFFSNNMVARSIGRCAFPIFAFLLAEGMKHTSDIKKYFIRLILFAIISEVPYDLAIFGTPFYINHQNIFFTLALGLFVIYCFEKYKLSKGYAYIIFAASLVMAYLCRFDYNVAGILIIYTFYVSGTYEPKTQKDKLILTTKLAFALAVINVLTIGLKQLFSIAALIPINMYSGRRGKYKLKYFFYIFYPLHLIILWMIKYVIIK